MACHLPTSSCSLMLSPLRHLPTSSWSPAYESYWLVEVRQTMVLQKKTHAVASDTFVSRPCFHKHITFENTHITHKSIPRVRTLEQPLHTNTHGVSEAVGAVSPAPSGQVGRLSFVCVCVGVFLPCFATRIDCIRCRIGCREFVR